MSYVSVRIAGANGDGIESSGALLVDVAAKNGLHVLGLRGYQSVVRGGHVWYQVRIGDEEVRGHGERADILVALNQDAITNQKTRLSDNAIVIYDSDETNVDELKSSGFKLVGIPLKKLAIEVGGGPIMRNMVALGAVLKFAGLEIDVLTPTIKKRFGKKGEKVINDNIQAASKGYTFPGVEVVHSLKRDGKGRYAMDGNTALALGAYSAGCKLYCAYPMTPASGVLHWFAANEDKGVVFKQTEDELAAMNMTIGAAIAGVRAACGSSGGGFSLMTEGLGMAGMLEAPIVVVESQRTGPSSGLPTKTGQSDLLFVIHASQGEFPRIVVAPTNVRRSFEIGANAFELADKYQVPVLILMDQNLSERMETVEEFGIDAIKTDRGAIAAAGSAEGRFKRYEITPDGVSPRAFPGTKGMEHIATSYEHNEYGDLVCDVLAGLDDAIDMRVQMHSKRMRKLETMIKNESIFVPTIVNPDAENFLVTFGSTTGAAMEAADALNKEGHKVGVAYFEYLAPLDAEGTKKLLDGKRLINVESNYTGQLAQVIRSTTGIEMQGSILKFDGEAFTGNEIARRARDLKV